MLAYRGGEMLQPWYQVKYKGGSTRLCVKTTVVAIYGYLILIVATITSLAIGQDRVSWTQTFAIVFILSLIHIDVYKRQVSVPCWLSGTGN